MRKIYTGRWWEHSWVSEHGQHWQIDFDLTMVGVGMAWCISNGSCFLCLPFLLVARDGRR